MENLAAPATEQLSIEDAIERLKSRHPQAVKSDDRDGYEGVIVDSDKLVEIARIIRDELRL